MPDKRIVIRYQLSAPNYCYLSILGQLWISLLQLQLQNAGSHEGETTEETAGDNSLQWSLQDTELPWGEVRVETRYLLYNYYQPNNG